MAVLCAGWTGCLYGYPMLLVPFVSLVLVRMQLTCCGTCGTCLLCFVYLLGYSAAVLSYHTALVAGRNCHAVGSHAASYEAPELMRKMKDGNAPIGPKVVPFWDYRIGF